MHHLPRFAPLLLLAGCATYHASASVARTEHGGFGVGVEGGGMVRPDRTGFGVFGSADISEGYRGDYDPIKTTTVHGRYGWRYGESKTVIPFVTAGAGVGWAWKYENAAVAEGFAEVGVEWRPADRFGLALSLRERPAAFISDGDPAVFWHNTLQLTLTLVGVAAPAE